MPTLNKLEYLDETKQQIKNALNTNFNSGITDEDTFRSYVGKINNIYTNWAKVTGEGTEITLNNTKKGKMALTPKGNTEQTHSILPSGYTQVEYIQGTGIQYIDIGRKMYNDSEIELCFSFDVIQQNCSIFGSRVNGSNNNFEIASATPEFPIYLDYGNYATSRATYNDAVINTKYICTISKSLRAVYDANNTLLASNTNLISVDNVTPSNARIFDTAGGFSQNKLKGKVYYCKIWEDNVLVRNFIPCTNPSNVAGMYDTVNEVFYANAGTGTFNVGPVISVPNPDYPQDIRVVTGNNTIIVSNSDNTQSQTYPINLGTMELCKIGDYQDEIRKSTGKNLFDKNNANILNASVGITVGINYGVISNSNNAKTLYIPIKSNTTYTVSKIASQRFIVGIINETPEIGKICNNIMYSSGGVKVTITSGVNDSYLCVYYYLANSDTLTEQQILDSIQIEESPTATDYEPFGKGKWYKHSEIGKYVYNNDLSTNGIDSQKVGFVTPVLNIEANITQNALSNLSYCNMLQTKMVNNTGLNGTTSQKKIRVYLSLNYATTYDEARAIFANNNLTIYYGLETPTNTEITDTTLISQLEALKSAKSYATQTNISQENNDKPFILNVSALKKNSSN